MPKKHCNIGETTHGRFYETKPRFSAATPFLRNEAKVCGYEPDASFTISARNVRIVQALGCKHCRD
jgi:hypothetical protein